MLVAFCLWLGYFYLRLAKMPRNKYVRCLSEMSVLNNWIFTESQVPLDNFEERYVAIFRRQLDDRKIQPIDMKTIAKGHLRGRVAVDDPWGVAYCFCMSNIEDHVEIKIWSCGPNEKDEGGGQDDVLLVNDSGSVLFRSTNGE